METDENSDNRDNKKNSNKNPSKCEIILRFLMVSPSLFALLIQSLIYALSYHLGNREITRRYEQMILSTATLVGSFVFGASIYSNGSENETSDESIGKKQSENCISSNPISRRQFLKGEF